MYNTVKTRTRQYNLRIALIKISSIDMKIVLFYY